MISLLTSMLLSLLHCYEEAHTNAAEPRIFGGKVQSNAIEPRVFGGQDSRHDVHPYMVALDIHYNGHSRAHCSGSIISRNWIISSAHCFDKPAKVFVSQKTAVNSRILAKVRSDNVYIHPRWSYYIETTHKFDIAMLKTSRCIKFNEYVRAIPLATMNPKNGQSGIIAGYGDSEKFAPRPREGVVNITMCETPPGSLCSEDLVRAGSGDSGGPLVSKGHLVGVTSASCVYVEEPKICITEYASVALNRDWILQTMSHK